MGEIFHKKEFPDKKPHKIAAKFIPAAQKIKLEVITENSSEKQDSRALSVGQAEPGHRGTLSPRSIAPPG